MRKELAIFLLLVVLCAIVTVLNPRFVSASNLQNTSRLIGAFGIFSLGLGLVIISGGIDLSVGSAFALLGVLLSIMLTEWHVAWPAAVLAMLGVGALLGWIHGWLITRLGLQPFIVTLCGLLLYRGLARFIADDETKGFGDSAGPGAAARGEAGVGDRRREAQDISGTVRRAVREVQDMR